MKVYDPRQVVIDLAGLLIASGFSEDSMIKVTQTSKRFESVVGVDGEVTRARLHDRRAVVVVSVMQSSEANDLLSALLNRDSNSPNGAGVGAFLLKDLNGTTELQGSHAWVTGLPETEFGKKVGSRQWEIEVADMSGVTGGAVGV